MLRTPGPRRVRRAVGVAAAALTLSLLPLSPAHATTPTPTPTPAPAPAAPAPAEGAPPAITVEGDQILRGGQPWWFVGYNSFVWSGNCGNDDEKMSAEDVEAWFASMRHDGHGAVRLFFFDGWDLDRLDAAVESARRHDIYLQITLDDAIAGCGESEKDGGWFSDSGERETYANHMTSLLERYRGETAIAWFEFFNEPSYEGGALREFYDEMGTLADSVDPDRLFSSGTVAPYWLDSAENFADVHESPGVDIASLHEYDEGEVESNHGPGVRANSGGKPVIVGEFGINAGSGCLGFDERADRIGRKLDVYTDTEQGYAGGMIWAWQPGGGGCELGNLDEDTATQDVVNTHRADESTGGADPTTPAPSDPPTTEPAEPSEPTGPTGPPATDPTDDEDGGTPEPGTHQGSIGDWDEDLFWQRLSELIAERFREAGLTP